MCRRRWAIAPWIELIGLESRFSAGPETRSSEVLPVSEKSANFWPSKATTGLKQRITPPPEGTAPRNFQTGDFAEVSCTAP